MPPVTALRSPPDSRITGADSPVIADSSTVAMPSITVPSPGISSPAGTTTTSPRVSSAAAFVEPSRIVATVSLRIVRSVSAWARPRPSANASAMFANTTVSHSQKAIVNVYQAGSWPPPSGLPPNDLDQPGDGRDHRADLDDEHHRVADLHARVELLEAVDQRAARRCRAGTARSPGVRGWPASARTSARSSCQAVEREVELEHVHAFLAGEAEPAARGVLGDQAVDRRAARGGARPRRGGPGSRRSPARFRGRGPRPSC